MNKDYFVGFWNLENLFAPEGFPGRLEWLEKRIRSDLKGWTEALFQRKMSQLATVIQSMDGNAGPDILGVCEVENRFVLDALVRRACQPIASATIRCCFMPMPSVTSEVSIRLLSMTKSTSAFASVRFFFTFS